MLWLLSNYLTYERRGSVSHRPNLIFSQKDLRWYQYRYIVHLCKRRTQLLRWLRWWQRSQDTNDLDGSRLKTKRLQRLPGPNKRSYHSQLPMVTGVRCEGKLKTPVSDVIIFVIRKLSAILQSFKLKPLPNAHELLLINYERLLFIRATIYGWSKTQNLESYIDHR